MKRLIFLLLAAIPITSWGQIGQQCSNCPPSGVGNSGKYLKSNGGKKAVWATISGLDTNTVNIDSLDYWGLNGNSGTTSANFIGTNDSAPLIIQPAGSVGIGTQYPLGYFQAIHKWDVVGEIVQAQYQIHDDINGNFIPHIFMGFGSMDSTYWGIISFPDFGKKHRML